MTPSPLITLLCVLIGTSAFSIGAFPILLPELGRAAALADWQLGIVVGVFGFARMLSDVPAGLFITNHLRWALVLGPVALAAGILCLGAGGPLALLVLGRALMGFGHTLGMLGGITAILRHAKGATLSSSLNAYEFSAMLGMLGGVALVGALPASLGWNLAYVVVCAPLALAVVVVPIVFRALPATAGAAAPLFARRARSQAVTGAPAAVTPLAAVAAIAGTAVAVTYSAVDQFMLPLRGSREFGLDRAGVARLFMVIQLCDIAALLPVGFLSDRHGARAMLGLVLLAFGSGALLIAFAPLPLVVAGCVLFGLGMAGWMLPLSVLRDETSPDQVAWRTALYRVSVDGGMFLGPLAGGLLGTGRAVALPAAGALVLAATAVLLLRYPWSERAGAPPP